MASLASPPPRLAHAHRSIAGRRTTTRHVAIGPSHKTALHHRLTCGVPPRRATTPFRVPARPRDLRLSPRVRHGVRERAQRRGEIVGVAPAARGRPAAVVTRSPRLVSRVPTPYPLPTSPVPSRRAWRRLRALGSVGLGLGVWGAAPVLATGHGLAPRHVWRAFTCISSVLAHGL